MPEPTGIGLVFLGTQRLMLGHLIIRMIGEYAKYNTTISFLSSFFIKVLLAAHITYIIK